VRYHNPRLAFDVEGDHSLELIGTQFFLRPPIVTFPAELAIHTESTADEHHAVFEMPIGNPLRMPATRSRVRARIMRSGRKVSPMRFSRLRLDVEPQDVIPVRLRLTSPGPVCAEGEAGFLAPSSKYQRDLVEVAAALFFFRWKNRIPFC
jgi:hypothetical protein